MDHPDPRGLPDREAWAEAAADDEAALREEQALDRAMREQMATRPEDWWG